MVQKEIKERRILSCYWKKEKSIIYVSFKVIDDPLHKQKKIAKYVDVLSHAVNE